MADEVKGPKVGDIVVYHDPVGKSFNALVTSTWSGTTINVVYVSGEETETDNYGRQTKRESSVSHKTSNPAHGRYWRYAEEEPNQYQRPTSV